MSSAVFMDAFEALADARDAREALAVAAKTAEADSVRFASWRALGPGQLSRSVSTVSPDWMRYYATAGFAELDPAFEPTVRAGPMVVDTLPALSRYGSRPGAARDMFEELECSLRVDASLFLPLRLRPGPADWGVNLLADTGSLGFEVWKREAAPRLRLLAVALHDRIRTLHADEDGADEPAPALTPRQAEALHWLASGRRVARIAE
ncbi:MAG: hypothetical protein AAF192_10640, partial [Pseudomonadota bacterium]